MYSKHLLNAPDFEIKSFEIINHHIIKSLLI
jgi:hypothetical protein